MFKFVKHMIRGCRDLEGYGPHPGTAMLFIVSIAGGLAGIDKGGFNGFVFGYLFAFFMTAPLYLHGAYSRSKLYERDQINLLKTIKES